MERVVQNAGETVAFRSTCPSCEDGVVPECLSFYVSTPKVGFQQCNVKNSCQEDFVIRHKCNSKNAKYYSLLGTKRNDLGPGSPDTWTCSMHSKDSFTVSLMGTLCSSAKRENSSTFDNEVSVEVPGYHENTNLYHSSHHLYHSFISQENSLKSNTQMLRKFDSRFALEHRYESVQEFECVRFVCRYH